MNFKTRTIRLTVTVVSILLFASLALWILGKVGLIGEASLQQLLLCSFLYSFFPISLVFWFLIRNAPKQPNKDKVFRLKTTVVSLAALILIAIPTGAFPEFSLAWLLFIPLALGLSWIPFRLNFIN